MCKVEAFYLLATVDGKSYLVKLSAYLANNEIVYDKQKMNGKYQVGSGRIVAIAHDTPFIDDSVSQITTKSNTIDKNIPRKDALPRPTTKATNVSPVPQDGSTIATRQPLTALPPRIGAPFASRA